MKKNIYHCVPADRQLHEPLQPPAGNDGRTHSPVYGQPTHGYGRLLLNALRGRQQRQRAVRAAARVRGHQHEDGWDDVVAAEEALPGLVAAGQVSDDRGNLDKWLYVFMVLDVQLRNTIS